MFWLPPDSEEKISLSITVLLAFSVFQFVVTDLTPTSSDSTPIIGTTRILLHNNNNNKNLAIANRSRGSCAQNTSRVFVSLITHDLEI